MVVSGEVDSAPTIVGTGGGMGIGVVFTAVETVKEVGVSITGAAMWFPIPEGWWCTN